MPDWLPPALVFAGVLVGFIGSLIGHRITASRNKSEAKKQKAELQLVLVDQLQEERDRLDRKLEAQEERHGEAVEKLNKRVTGFYADKHASRRYIASLENHINKGSPPPPPEPPIGYVP